MGKKDDQKAIGAGGSSGAQKDPEMEKFLMESQDQIEKAQRLVKNLNRMTDIKVSSGPFHYQMRAGV